MRKFEKLFKYGIAAAYASISKILKYLQLFDRLNNLSIERGEDSGKMKRGGKDSQ